MRQIADAHDIRMAAAAMAGTLQVTSDEAAGRSWRTTQASPPTWKVGITVGCAGSGRGFMQKLWRRKVLALRYIRRLFSESRLVGLRAGMGVRIQLHAIQLIALESRARALLGTSCRGNAPECNREPET